MKRLDSKIAEKGLQDNVRALRCSHVGGHKVGHIHPHDPIPYHIGTRRLRICQLWDCWACQHEHPLGTIGWVYLQGYMLGYRVASP